VNLLIWIEGSAFAEYVRVAAYGYPIMITLHSLGLAIMVGLSVVLSMRILGAFSAIPYATLHKQLKFAWVGFVINFLSGGALFASQATTYITDFEFLLKMAFVFIGAILVAILQGKVKAGSGGWDARHPPPAAVRSLAALAIVAWAGGMITGRLIAYL